MIVISLPVLRMFILPVTGLKSSRPSFISPAVKPNRYPTAAAASAFEIMKTAGVFKSTVILSSGSARAKDRPVSVPFTDRAFIRAFFERPNNRTFLEV